MKKNKCLPWDEVEKAIYKEKEWLKKNIEISPYPVKDLPITCPDCIRREIAILILSGKIKAKEIKSKQLWGDLNLSVIKKHKGKKHGGVWHSGTMEMVSEYFKNQDYKVENEPRLNYGNADLLVYKKGEKDIYVEVGTVSLYKLLYNFNMMNGIDLLIIPKDDYLIEFNL